MKSTSADVAILYDDQAAPNDRAAALSRIGADRIYQHEGHIASLLGHPSPSLRLKSIAVLVGLWSRRQYLPRAIQALHGDPDWNVRGRSALSLSTYARYAANDEAEADRQMIQRELARALVLDSDEGAQALIYEALQGCTSSDINLSPGVPFSLERDVDWDVVKPFLDEEMLRRVRN